MEYMYDLKDKLCKELDEIASKHEMSAGDLETVHKLTDTIKNIYKIDMLDSDSEYSQGGGWEARGTYDRGNSYAGRRNARRDSMGRYSRTGGNTGNMPRMYSRADAKEEMMQHLDEMMDAATTDREREIIRRCMAQLRDA